MSRLIRPFFILALNAIPLVGVLYFGWSAGTLLVVIWFEVLLVGVANVVRIWLHRTWTEARGHYRLHFNENSGRVMEKSLSKGKASASRPAPKSGTLLSEYATLTFVFTLAHGLFLAVILGMFSQNWRGEGPPPWQIDPHALQRGVLAVAALTAIELLTDLTSLRAWPFSGLKERVQLSMGQVVIVHLAIIFGMFLLTRFETPLVFLGIIIALKTLVELGRSAQKRELPPKPPGWLTAFAKSQKLDMEREWTRILAEEKRKTIDDEIRAQ